MAFPLIAGYAYGKGNWRNIGDKPKKRLHQPHYLAQLFIKPQQKNSDRVQMTTSTHHKFARQTRPLFCHYQLSVNFDLTVIFLLCG
ncbi:MAG: hypothetical protein V7L21_35125 [Nostoc sp.]|uniref:hypothetical protein n=1 Tax=unclassified Nostoc TaxID=2593658 RepID=UPI0025DE98CA|nr:hypothetical protein [Nostoc sp. NMS9]